MHKIEQNANTDNIIQQTLEHQGLKVDPTDLDEHSLEKPLQMLHRQIHLLQTLTQLSVNA